MIINFLTLLLLPILLPPPPPPFSVSFCLSVSLSASLLHSNDHLVSEYLFHRRQGSDTGITISLEKTQTRVSLC